MATVFNTSDNNFGVSKWIVNSTAGLGTHTTLASAMASASSGDTIFLMTSVTENVTITPGVNITAWVGGSLNTPSITGTLTMTGAGTSTLSGLELITNSAAIISVTGSAASILNVNNCYLNCSNNSGITFSSSSASSQINIKNCQGNLGTTGINYFAHSGGGTLNIYNSVFNNSGNSTTANTVSGAAGSSLALLYTFLASPITSSSTGSFTIYYSQISSGNNNVTVLTIGDSSAASSATKSTFISGTASAISISGTGTITNCDIISTNTNAITGAGTIIYSGLTFGFNASSTINTTTQSQAGTLQGSKNTAPTAGMLGEQIRSAIGSGSAITLTTTGTTYNITSISLTAGIWDVTAAGEFTGNSSVTEIGLSINTVSVTLGTFGDNYFLAGYPTTSSRGVCTVPAYRLTLSTTTTVYMSAISNFTGASPVAFGRLSATRVG